MNENNLSKLFKSFTEIFSNNSKTISLAESSIREGGSKDRFEEVGVKGEQMIRSYEKEEVRIDNLAITDYRRMMDNDGQVQMLINAIFSTIISAGVDIVDDPEVESERDSEELEFIKKNLLAPKHKGGMELSMDLTNKYFLRAFIEGYRISEIVYKVGDDGKIYLRKLAPRAAGTDSEFKIITDENGNFRGIRQRLSWAGQPIDVKILNDGEIKKVLHVAYGSEYGSLYGRSGLRAAWYHYDKAHKGMFLNHVGHELGVVNPRIIYTKGNTDADARSRVISAFDRIHLETSVMLPEDNFKVEFPTVTSAEVMREGKEMINMHYSLLSKSLLAQFIDLGTTETGSRALGDSQISFFKQGLQSIANELIETPWNEVIADLIKINFNRGVYPTLKVNPISDEKAALIHNMLLELVKKGDVTTSVKKEIVEKGIEILDLDVSDEVLDMEYNEQEIEKKAMQENMSNQKQEEKTPEKKNINVTVKKEMVKASEIGLNDDYITDEFSIASRPLYLDEQKVNLVDIKRKLDTARLSYETTLGIKLEKTKEEIINSYLEAMRSGRSAIKKVKVELAENETTYSQELRELSNDIYEYGKRTSSTELDVAVPSTPAKESLYIKDQTDSVIDMQETNLEQRLYTVANNSLDAEIPENETKLLLEQEYDSYWGKVLIPTVSVAISKMFNRGRNAVFQKYWDLVFAVRYTAVLDSKTTDYCKELDGKVFQLNDKNYALLTPPNHFGCRSFWTPIKISESEGVVVEGKPDEIEVYGSLNSFKDLSDESVEKELNDIIGKLEL